MKLRNKKTGEIKEIPDGFICNIRQLCEEWEDYENPVMKWCITQRGGLFRFQYSEDEFCEGYREIGNCFNTKKEAEQAVEKLKAWKRLQDAGVTFHVKVIDYKWYLMPKTNDESVTFKDAHQIYKDIDLVFGVKDNEGDN